MSCLIEQFRLTFIININVVSSYIIALVTIQLPSRWATPSVLGKLLPIFLNGIIVFVVGQDSLI